MIQVAVLGYGTVGSGVVEVIEKNKAEIIGVFSTSEICGSISFTLIVRWYVILFSQV